ncbi:MAG TPA: ornithine decarboxylase, partial [Alphaproteobacteria bacterium]
MVPHDGPLLVIDLNTVRNNYRAFRASMPEAKVFYAVKANPAPDLLKMLALQGSSFDVASLSEVKMALAAGASPDRISFGNTIKKEKDIKVAYDLGIR